MVAKPLSNICALLQSLNCSFKDHWNNIRRERRLATPWRQSSDKTVFNAGPQCVREVCLLLSFLRSFHGWEHINFTIFSFLFSGPYYTYQMLLDSQNPVLKSWDPTTEVSSRFKRLLWSVPVFVITNHYFPLDVSYPIRRLRFNFLFQTLRSDAIWEVSFFTRLVYAAMIFVVFKTRVYR